MKKNKMNKIIGIFLILVFSISNFVNAETYSPAAKELQESKSIELKNELATRGISYYINKGGKRLLNYYVYRDPFYGGKIVYGNPQDIENIPKFSDITKRMEYRYLGWNKYGVTVTNSYYPNDVVNGINPKVWTVTNGTYVNKANAINSWKKIDDKNASIYEYNRRASLQGNGLKYEENWSARDFDGGNDNNIKTEILTAAGLFTSGTVKVEHTDSGVKYGTFNSKVIPTVRRESLQVNKEYATRSTIQNGQDKEINNKSVKVDFSATKDSIQLDLDIASNIESSEPLFSDNMISEYKISFVSYELENVEVPFSHSKTEANKSNVQFNKVLPINRDDLKIGENYLKINWFVEIETATEKPIKESYQSTIVIMVTQGNKPPVAKITAESQIFVGETVNIVGSGEDKETLKENLIYKWSGDIKGLSDEYPAIGGNYRFDAIGTYNIQLTVIDEGNLSSTVSKNIEVKSRGEVLLDLEGSIDPTSYTYMKGQNIVPISIQGQGKVVKLSGKSLKKAELLVEQFNSKYDEGDRAVVSTQIFEGMNPIQKDFSFNVDTKGEDYTQYFRLTYKVSFTDGTSQTKETILSSKLGSKEPILPNAGVMAIPNPVRAGDEFIVSVYGSDSDGQVVAKYSSIQHNGDMNMLLNLQYLQKGWMKWYPSDVAAGTKEKTYKLSGAVVDDDGLAAVATGKLKVLPPEVLADFSVQGTLKENRKVVIDGTAISTPKYYPITNFSWSIEAYDGGAEINSLRYDGSLNELKKEILFKKAGRYKIKLNAANDAGYTDEVIKLIEILPDEVPEQSFSVQKINKSDPSDNNRALLTALSSSYSKDGDYIDRRVWFVAFDSDNDGDYKEESWYVNTNNTWIPVSSFGVYSYDQLKNIDLSRLSKDNKNEISIKVQAVGDYYFEELVIERFGQETIDRFVTSTDRRRNSSFN